MVDDDIVSRGRFATGHQRQQKPGTPDPEDREDKVRCTAQRIGLYGRSSIG